jgi:hypothetical protein
MQMLPCAFKRFMSYHDIVITVFEMRVENHLPKPDASCCGVVVRKR